MELDVEFTKSVLLAFQEHEDDAFMPVALIAKHTNDSENIEEGEANSRYTLSNKLVFHLLHLQDLNCIQNMNGECSWGYLPSGNHQEQVHQLIDEALESGKFETPHAYNATSQESVIRLTATGIQMLEVLQQSAISENLRKLVVEFGKAALPTALGAML